MSERENKKKHKHKRISKRRLRRRLKIAALVVVTLAVLFLTAWIGNRISMYGTVIPEDTKPVSSMQFSSESSETLYRMVEKTYPASVAKDCLSALKEAGFADVLKDITMDADGVLHATTDDEYTIDVFVQFDVQQQVQVYVSHISPKAILTMASDIRFTKDQDHYTACVFKNELFGVYNTEEGTITDVSEKQLVIAFNESLQNPSADISQPGFIKDNPIVIAADTLVEEIKTDINAAKAKYDGKYIKVTAEIKQAVSGGTITKYYIYGKQEDTGLRIVCWQEGAPQENIREGRTYSFLGRIRGISEENVTEITECEIQLDESANRSAIEISSPDQIYALGRILQSSAVHMNYISKDITYDILNDFATFTYPEDVVTVAEKTEYLRTASYKLVDDIEISLQKSAGAEYFTGIGSADKVFTGIFDGNGKTVTMKAKGIFDFTGVSDYGTGLFDETEGATIRNLNVNVVSDIKVTATTGLTNVGIIVGDADQTLIENCKVTITNAVVGAEYTSTQNVPTNIGGIAGISTFSTIRNCQVIMENATLKGTGTTANPARDYGGIAVGGILGFSGAGSNNSENIGKLGNQLYNCTVTSKNDVQTDVIIASVETGKELTVGGIVGCTFNNILIDSCTVDVEKGNISAVKTGATDGAIFGAQAGGIIGRMEHTGEVTGCNVLGNYLTILSKSPNNVTCAGGIVGIDMGPYHRDIHTINRSYFDGAGTSNIRVEITSTDTLSRDKIIAAGGIVGSGSYIISDCAAKNVTVTNNTANIGNPTTYVGEIAGFVSLKKTNDIYGTGYNWFYNTYFKKRNPGLYDCFSENVNVVKTENVQNLMY